MLCFAQARSFHFSGLSGLIDKAAILFPTSELGKQLGPVHMYSGGISKK